MNKAYLIGRLTNAPEQKQTPTGVSVTNFSIAVNRKRNREITDYFNIVAWRGLADLCAKYLAKGHRVAVAGEIHTRSYEAKDGSKRYVTEIVADDVEFLESRDKSQVTISLAEKKEQKTDGKFVEIGGVMVEEIIDDGELPF